MKAALITIVDNINFGTYLQAYACVMKLKNIFTEIEVINYIRPYLNSRQIALEYLKDTRKSWIKRVIYALSYMIVEPFMIWNVKKFLTKRVKMSKRYNSYYDLIKCPPKADYYITGSDQVWNYKHNHGLDYTFFWAGINGYKCSYASSIGTEDISDIKIQDEMAKLLQEYKYISVRESSAQYALNKIGLRNVQHVLDPTLLLNKEQWAQHANKKFKKEESYLLIYTVEKEKIDVIKEQATIIAKQYNYKIYVVCPTIKFKKDYNADKVFNLASVELFLSLFLNADFVLASSFHGTAFAINFNKNFLTISPGAFSSRVNSLLEITNLQDRYISKPIYNYNTKYKDIDYNIVNNILEKNRKKSEDYLNSFIR